MNLRTNNYKKQEGKNIRKINYKTRIVSVIFILIIVLCSRRITKQIFKTFGTVENIEITTRSIGPEYYMPYYKQKYVDVYSKSILTNTYIKKVKINENETAEFGDIVNVEVKLYKLGNKYTVEPIKGEIR